MNYVIQLLGSWSDWVYDFCMSLDNAYHQFYVKLISYEILNKKIEM